MLPGSKKNNITGSFSLQRLRLSTKASSNYRDNTSYGIEPRFSAGNSTDNEDESRWVFAPIKAVNKVILAKEAAEDFNIHRPPRWAFQNEELSDFPTETDSLKVLIVTWNIFGQKPGEIVEKLLNTNNTDHHIIAIAAQECLRSIAASLFIQSKAEWTDLLQKHLNSDYTLVGEHSMNAIHLIVFARKAVFPLIKEVESAEIATGFLNVLGNKGAVGVSFKINGYSFIFLSSHLASGQSSNERRNEDFLKVTNEIPLPSSYQPSRGIGGDSSVLDRFDYVFYAGDLNYRIDLSVSETMELFNTQNFQDLLDKDQLNIEMTKSNSIYNGFSEGQIRFAPTYKFGLDEQGPSSINKRGVAWTDRILYACQIDDSRITQVNYDSNREVLGSDHRPVFSQFSVRVPKEEKMFFEGARVNPKFCCF